MRFVSLLNMCGDFFSLFNIYYFFPALLLVIIKMQLMCVRLFVVVDSLSIKTLKFNLCEMNKNMPYPNINFIRDKFTKHKECFVLLFLFSFTFFHHHHQNKNRLETYALLFYFNLWMMKFIKMWQSRRNNNNNKNRRELNYTFFNSV